MTTPGRQASGRAARPAYIAHFVIRTAKFQQTLDWYRRFFDTRDVFVSEQIAFITYDDEHHRIAIINDPSLKPFDDDRAGVDHIAFSMASLGDLLDTYERLKGEGIVPAFPINHGPTTSIYYVDPNGVKVEIQVDNSSLEDGPESFFRTSAFAANPIGVMFDPDVLLRKYREGADVNELLQQGSTEGG